MADHFNELTPAQAEALALLAEEAGEIVQAVCKALRHGLYSFNPNDEHETTNRTLIENEIGDLFAAVDILVRLRVVNLAAIEVARRGKHVRVGRYLHHIGPTELTP